MSYILDALRRADAERERDRAVAPGLHSQEYQRVEPDADDEASLLPPLSVGRLLLLGLLLAGLVAGLAWRFWPESPAVPAAQIAAAAQPVPIQPMAPAPPQAVAQSASEGLATSGLPALLPAQASSEPNAAPSMTAAPATAVAAMPQAPAAKPPAMPSSAGIAPVPTVGRPPPSSPSPATALPRTTQPPRPGTVPLAPGGTAGSPGAAQPPETNPQVLPAAAMAAPPSRTAAAAAAAATAVPKLRELPEAQRRELPALSVSGSMYSPDAASRMLVLDGQVLREGQTAQPGLVLEQIGPKSAILSHKGQRFELPY